MQVLAPATQKALRPLLEDNTRAATLHEPAYSMVAWPWATRYQQSNQWALETLALAMEPSATDRRAQSWLQFRGYVPTTLRIDAMKRLGARVGSAHIAFDDHPNAPLRRSHRHRHRRLGLPLRAECETGQPGADDPMTHWKTGTGKTVLSARGILRIAAIIGTVPAVRLKPDRDDAHRYPVNASAAEPSQFALLGQRRFAPFFWTQFLGRPTTTCSSSPSRCW